MNSTKQYFWNKGGCITAPLSLFLGNKQQPASKHIRFANFAKGKSQLGSKFVHLFLDIWRSSPTSRVEAPSWETPSQISFGPKCRRRHIL